MQDGAGRFGTIVVIESEFDGPELEREWLGAA